MYAYILSWLSLFVTQKLFFLTISPYSGHVEPVQEILNACFCLFVHMMGIFEFKHSLCHCTNRVITSLFNFTQRSIVISHDMGMCLPTFIFYKVSKTVSILSLLWTKGNFFRKYFLRVISHK